MRNIKRTRLQPIRTVTEGNTEPIECAAQITASIKLLPVKQLSIYQKLARKTTQLRLLRMAYKQIAKSLNVNKKTTIRACKYGMNKFRQKY